MSNAAPKFSDGRRDWVYTARVKGHYQKLHRASGIVLQLILFITPWIMIGGNPALRIDLPGRKLYVLGGIFGATDTFFLVLIGLFLAFSLFFITSLFGRLWCGYLCPQTVFLEEWVRRIELWIEGDRGKRRARDKKPMSFDKAWRKAAKWSAFAGLAAVVSMTLVSYFTGARELWTGQAGGVSYSLVGVFALGMFADFAWFREQFCNYLCPYARFQGALSDDHSLTVAYNVALGEPRAKGKRQAGEQQAAFGACVDCNKCVTVCPQGIDIRNGFQLECINCGRCVDACTDVMGHMEQGSLITYTSVAEQEGRERRWLRPRTVAYAALLSTIALVFTGMLLTRHELDGSVNRAPGSLFQVDADGAVRNTYLLQVTNNHPADEPAVISVEVEGAPEAEVVVGDISLMTEESRTVPLIIRMPRVEGMPRTVPLTIHLSSDFDAIELNATFKTDGGAPLEG
jgi:cytochrome c oxidase accessory protein FixG